MPENELVTCQSCGYPSHTGHAPGCTSLQPQTNEQPTQSQSDVDSARMPQNSILHRELPLGEQEKLQVATLVEELTVKFNHEGADLREYLSSSDSGKQARVNNYLFSRAVEEDDPERRRLLHLAHLQLECAKHKSTETLSPYRNRLSKSGRPLAEVFPAYFYFDQMLSSGQEIPKGMQGQKLTVETEKMEEVFLKFAEYCRVIRENLHREHGMELIKGVPQEQVAAILATQQTVIEYFGLPDEHSVGRNMSVYKKDQATVADFAGTKSAMCTEYALLTQQLNAFAGLETTFISGGPLGIGNKQGEFDASDFEGHAYNLIKIKQMDGNETLFLYDSVNPIIEKSEKDPTTMQLKIYFAPLDTQQSAALQNGRNMFVEYNGTRRIYSLT